MIAVVIIFVWSQVGSETVLKLNDYDMEDGEPSVYGREAEVRQHCSDHSGYNGRDDDSDVAVVEAEPHKLMRIVELQS